MNSFLTIGERIIYGKFCFFSADFLDLAPKVKRNLCALCGCNIIHSNDTEEHMIPQSIGGRLKVRGFICRKCNSQSGDRWDVELAKQLNALNLLCGVKRERKPAPSQVFNTVSGESLLWKSDGSYTIPKTIVNKEENGSVVNYNVTVSDTKEARKVLKGIVNKHPELNVDDLLSQAVIKQDYLDSPLQVNLQIGGQQAGRSMVKTALSMVYASGVDTSICNVANKYICCENSDACFGYYSQGELVKGKDESIPLHCVAVKGDPSTGLVLGYVELFGTYQVVLLLSDCYMGEKFYNSHAIDPVKGEYVEVEVDLQFDIKDVNNIFAYKMVDYDFFIAKFSAIIERAQDESFERERRRVIDLALKDALKECGIKEGDIIEPRHAEKISLLMIEKLMPFLLHFQRRD